MWYYWGGALTASGCRVDLIKRNGETDRTKYKFTPELIKIFNCFCWNVNNNKSNVKDNVNNNDNDYGNINDSNNSSSSNNTSYKIIVMTKVIIKVIIIIVITVKIIDKFK